MKHPGYRFGKFTQYFREILLGGQQRKVKLYCSLLSIENCTTIGRKCIYVPKIFLLPVYIVMHNISRTNQLHVLICVFGFNIIPSPCAFPSSELAIESLIWRGIPEKFTSSFETVAQQLEMLLKAPCVLARYLPKLALISSALARVDCI